MYALFFFSKERGEGRRGDGEGGGEMGSGGGVPMKFF